MPLMQAKLLCNYCSQGCCTRLVIGSGAVMVSAPNTAVLSLCSAFSTLGNSMTTGFQQGPLLFSYLVRPQRGRQQLNVAKS